MTRISDSGIRAIKGSNRIIARLMILYNRGQNTIENWMAARDIRLTAPAAVQIIREESGLEDSEILEDTVASEEPQR